VAGPKQKEKSHFCQFRSFWETVCPTVVNGKVGVGKTGKMGLQVLLKPGFDDFPTGKIKVLKKRGFPSPT
jgi:hypothetical protein